MNPPLLRSQSPRQLELLIVFTLVATGLAIYGQTLGFPFISFDDPGYVLENPHVSHGLSWDGWRWAWTSFERSNWHPLTWLSLMLDAQLYGLNAGGYHLTNVLLHLVNAVLLFRWLRMATGAIWPSALTALFFVTHPLHVESVAWITERKDVLSTFFLCLTLLAYTCYARGGGWRFYLLTLALFALGLAAKPMLVTLPVLLLLLDFWPLRRGTDWRRLMVEKIPFFLLVAGSCAVTFIAQHSAAVVPLEALPISYRLASAMLGYGFYLRATFWPLDLGVYYPYWRVQSMWTACAWATALAAMTAGVIVSARWVPWLFVGWCWFLGTLVPVIGVVQVGGQAVADRYAYVPHIGLFIALFWTGAALTRRWPRTRNWLAAGAAASAVVCLTLAWRQANYWSSSAALFEHTVSVVHPSGRLYHLLGDALVQENRLVEAEGMYRRAWNAGARDEETVTPWSTLLLKRGQCAEVAALLKPFGDRPHPNEDLLNNLAFALARLGRNDESAAMYRRCVSLHPDYPMAYFGLAELLQSQGDTINAAGEYEAGLAKRDDWLPALTRLARYYATGENGPLHDRACILAQRAVEVSKGQDLGSLDALATADAAMGRWREAVAAAQAAYALAIRPGAPAGAAELCHDRLETYRQGRLPSP